MTLRNNIPFLIEMFEIVTIVLLRSIITEIEMAKRFVNGLCFLCRYDLIVAQSKDSVNKYFFLSFRLKKLLFGILCLF